METQHNANAGKNPSSEFTMPTTFIFHEDASHGWLELPRAALKLLLLEDQITGYSYQKEDMVYLEEDQDMFTFIQAYLVHTGKKDATFSDFPYTSSHDGDQSPIRGYEHYRKA